MIEKDSPQQDLSLAKKALLERRLRGDASVVGAAQTVTMVDEQQHRHEPFPLTDMVEAQWMGRNNSYDLGNQSAHVYAEFFDGELDLDRFTRAWRRLIDRHEMLRAFVRPDGQYQILEHVPPYEIVVTDVRRWPRTESEDYLLAIRRRMARQVSPTDRWPLFEIIATRIDEKRTRLHLSCDLLISDIKSFQIIGKELAVLYQSPDATLRPDRLDASYRNYVLTLHNLKQTDRYQRDRDYWITQRLPDLPPAPKLPMFKTPSAVDIPYFVHRAGTVDKVRWRQLKALAARFDLTADTLVLAVFAEVIGRWNAAQRFTVNVLSFQRMPIHLQINEIVGNFGSTILLGVDLSKGCSFLERARQIHARLLADLDHGMFSGVRLLREINRQKGGSRGATMPVVFASTLNFSSGKEPSLHGERNTSFYEQHMKYIQLQTPQVWFDHQVSEEAGNLVLEWDVVEDLFPPGLINSMWSAYLRFFDQLFNEAAWLDTQGDPLLPDEDRALYRTLNATEGPVPDGLLHQGFLEQARSHPERQALLWADGQMSYGDLDRRSSAVAQLLRKRGVGANRLIAVAMEPGPEQAIAVLGVLRAGAAYLPIDPHLPQERLQYLVENGQVELVLAQPWLVGRLELPAKYSVIAVDIQQPLTGKPAAQEPASGASPADLVYVIYTSGSTGEPKGVMLDHRAVLNTVIDINQRFAVGPQDRVLALSNLNFDLSVYDLFGPLSVGAAVVLTSPAGHREPAHWAGLLREHGVTIWNSVPALLEMLTSHLEVRNDRLPESLRLVMLSGDWISLKLPGQIRALRGPGCEIVSLGGATEAAIWSIYHPIDEVDPTWSSIPYGRPLRNQRFHVLNERLGTVPRFVTGELYIAGVGLARGYYRDEQKTQAHFFTHPHTGEALYRTGDLGRYREDGTIELLGRADAQVKVHGHRIELGEIEAMLLAHPEIRAAVAVVGGEGEGRHLEAYVVPSGASAPSPEALAAFLREKLPDYMIPTELHTLERLPVTRNGKVDRAALSRPSKRSTKNGHQTPSTPLAKQVAEIWTRVLNCEQVGATDNFFELGGNSLLVTHVAARIFEEMQVDLPLRALYDAPTVNELAQLLAETQSASPGAPLDLLGEGMLPAEIHA